MDISQFRHFGKKIICVGRNYKALAAEQGNPIPESPIVFFKLPSSYIREGEAIKVPPGCENMFHEVELGLVIGGSSPVRSVPESRALDVVVPPGCENMFHEVELGLVIGASSPVRSVPEAQAMDAVAGYALCLDMTAMDFQMAAKEAGQPWALAKGFDTACPVSGFIPKEKVPDLLQVRLWMKRNDEMKQDSLTTDMIFSVPYVVSYISRYFSLEHGDLILTGSPAGAGPVSRGDTLEAGLDVGADNVKTMTFKIE